jgi:hypothetical protein
MLQRVRARVRAIAATVLVAVSALAAAGAVPHDDDCHAGECAAWALQHDPSGHAVRGAAGADQAHEFHCVVCHWYRSVRPRAEAVHSLARPAAGDVRIQGATFALPAVFPAAQPPLRSPPATPHHATSDHA